MAGLSAAHHISSNTHCFSDSQKQHITIFERDARIGGRVHTVQKYNHSCRVLETGGATFDAEDGPGYVTLLLQGLGLRLVDEKMAHYYWHNAPFVGGICVDGKLIMDVNEVCADKNS
jgi:protoporphyrinogen oxidase